MIFGIKTKKDKRIEELENLLSYTLTTRLKAQTKSKDVVTLRRNQLVEPGVDVEFAKQLTVKRFSEDLRPYVKFEEVVSPSGDNILYASLEVLKDKGGYI
jgi:hypothetical protein